MNETSRNIDWFQVGDSDLWLSADRHCWKVGRKALVTRGKAREQVEEYREVTYHGTLEQALHELLDRKAKSLPIESIEDAITAYREAHEWVKGLIPELAVCI